MEWRFGCDVVRMLCGYYENFGVFECISMINMIR